MAGHDADPMRFSKLSSRIAQELRNEVGERRFLTWFDGRAGLELTRVAGAPHGAGGSINKDDRRGGDAEAAATLAPPVGSGADQPCLVVSVQNPFERDCVRRQFSAHLHAACVAAGLASARICFRIVERGPAAGHDAAAERRVADPLGREVVRDCSSQSPHPQPAPVEQTAPQAVTTPDRPAGLASLVVGAPNLAAATLAGDLASDGEVASPLLLWGGSGVGKTMLLRGLRREVRLRGCRVKAIYLTAEQFTTAFVEAVHGRGLPGFRNKHRGVELLLLDDLQFLLNKTKTIEELLYTLDTLAAAGATAVLASDRPLAALKALGPELASRLAGGLEVEVGAPDHAMRTRLVRRLADGRGLPLDDATTDVIAQSVIGGARELGGVVNRLHAQWRLLGAPLDAEAVQSAVDTLNGQTTPHVRLADIQRAVCRVFGVDRAELRSSKRTKSIAEPRMLAMWLSRKYTRAAWSEIGEYYGRRSHSTVISAYRRVDSLRNRTAAVRTADGDRNLHEALRQVEAELRTA